MDPVTSLLRSDLKLAQVIRFCGSNSQRILSKGYDSDYEALVRAIISQQISTSAARAITNRLLEKVGESGITPDSVSVLTEIDFRSVGVSGPKARYILDLAYSVIKGDLNLSLVHVLEDEEVVLTLQKIKGIGRWTAQMFAIVQMGRQDIFPIGDGGIKSAMIKLYGLDSNTPESEFFAIAENWKPYRTTACRFLWMGLDKGYFR